MNDLHLSSVDVLYVQDMISRLQTPLSGNKSVDIPVKILIANQHQSRT